MALQRTCTSPISHSVQKYYEDGPLPTRGGRSGAIPLDPPLYFPFFERFCWYTSFFPGIFLNLLSQSIELWVYLIASLKIVQEPSHREGKILGDRHGHLRHCMFCIFGEYSWSFQVPFLFMTHVGDSAKKNHWVSIFFPDRDVPEHDSDKYRSPQDRSQHHILYKTVSRLPPVFLPC